MVHLPFGNLHAQPVNFPGYFKDKQVSQETLSFVRRRICTLFVKHLDWDVLQMRNKTPPIRPSDYGKNFKLNLPEVYNTWNLWALTFHILPTVAHPLQHPLVYNTHHKKGCEQLFAFRTYKPTAAPALDIFLSFTVISAFYLYRTLQSCINVVLFIPSSDVSSVRCCSSSSHSPSKATRFLL